MSLSSIITFAAIAALSIGRASAAPLELRQAATAVKIVLGNDDGWAEANIRQFYSDLVGTGKDVILSAPAYNMSGTGSFSDLGLGLPLLFPGEYNSIPVGSPALGSDANDHRINYYNGFPADGVREGIETLGPVIWGTGLKPDLILAGPNVGSNLGIISAVSGTVGASTNGLSHGIPSVAFSGGNGTFRPYTDLAPGDVSHVYSELAMKLTDQLITSGVPYLPSGVQLNVNFADVTPECSKSAYFKWHFTKVYSIAPGMTCPDGTPLATESAIIKKGCTVSVSAMSVLKTDVDVNTQAKVYQKLSGLLAC